MNGDNNNGGNQNPPNEDIERENFNLIDQAFQEDLTRATEQIDRELDEVYGGQRADIGDRDMRQAGRNAIDHNRNVDRQERVEDVRRRLGELHFGEGGRDAAERRLENPEAKKPDLGEEEQKRKANEIQENQKEPEPEPEQMERVKETEIKGNVEVRVEYEQTGNVAQDKGNMESAERTAREEIEAKRQAIREQARGYKEKELNEKFQEKSKGHEGP